MKCIQAYSITVQLLEYRVEPGIGKSTGWVFQPCSVHLVLSVVCKTFLFRVGILVYWYSSVGKGCLRRIRQSGLGPNIPSQPGQAHGEEHEMQARHAELFQLSVTWSWLHFISLAKLGLSKVVFHKLELAFLNPCSPSALLCGLISSLCLLWNMSFHLLWGCHLCSRVLLVIHHFHKVQDIYSPLTLSLHIQLVLAV